MGIYPERTLNSKRYIHPNVHCSTIYNSQGMEATYMSINIVMDKEDVIHIKSGILLSHKRLSFAATWMVVILSEVRHRKTNII